MKQVIAWMLLVLLVAGIYLWGVVADDTEYLKMKHDLDGQML